MPVSGAAPKPDRQQIRNRNRDPLHDWTDVERIPFEGAPALRARATSGVSVMDVGAANSAEWPGATLDWWEDISHMPHAKLWDEAEWRYAMDTAEVHARTMEAWRGYTGAELRNREKFLGMLPDHRRGLRIRYIEPRAVPDPDALPAGVTRLADFRDL